MPSQSSATTTADNRFVGIALVCTSVVIWGMGGLFTRLLPFDLWTIVFWRGVFATAFIGAYAFYTFGTSLPRTIAHAGWPGLVVTVCLGIGITVFPAAFQSTSIANAFTIFAALPFMTAPIAWLVLRERPTVVTLVASVLALAGIVIMVGPSNTGPRIGDLFAAIGTLMQALTTVVIRRSPHVPMLPMAWTAVILSVVVSYPMAVHLFDLSPVDYLVAAGFGLGPMTLGMMLFVIGSAMIPATLSALIGVAEAPLGTLWAWIGVGEVPTTTTAIGGGIVLASVIGRLILDRASEGLRSNG